jgi:SAM-dependent MidA family methyltransferase
MDNGLAANNRPMVSSPLVARIADAIRSSGGFLPFSGFMREALYAPGLGYYARAGSGAARLGRMPGSGSDFVTAPLLSPLFGRVVAGQVAEALLQSGTTTVTEFGAGTGALAAQLIEALDARADVAVERYAIVELSPSLRALQREALARFGERVAWLETWPDAIRGVVVGNEVLDAMPVDLVHRSDAGWLERGVGLAEDGGFVWSDRPGGLRPPLDPGFATGATTEVHREAPAFVASLGERLEHGAALFIDYGFPEHEYYHPDRSAGTLACHRGHRVDFDPLTAVGEKDITAHVDWTGIALAAQDAGLAVAGYTSQARFLLNGGLGALLDAASPRDRSDALKLVHEHEMGELFKAMLLVSPGLDLALSGFASGDRTHRL